MQKLENKTMSYPKLKQENTQDKNQLLTLKKLEMPWLGGDQKNLKKGKVISKKTRQLSTTFDL